MGAKGWGLIIVPRRIVREPMHHESALLARAVFETMRGLVSSTWCPPEYCTFVVDDQYGHEMPTSLPELLSTLRNPSQGVVFWNTDSPLILNERLAENVRFAKYAQLGSAVKSVDLGNEARTTFKRYRSARPLCEEEVLLMSRMQGSADSRLPLNSCDRHDIAILERLSVERVIEFSIDQSFERILGRPGTIVAQ